MVVGEALAVLASELDDPTLAHHGPDVAVRALNRAQTWMVLIHGLLRRTLMLPVVAKKGGPHPW